MFIKVLKLIRNVLLVIAANFCTQKQEKVIDPSKDRRIPIDLDTSIKYMKSDGTLGYYCILLLLL